MTPTILDVTKPESAANVGTELADTTLALVTRLALSTVNDVTSCEQAVLDRQDIAASIKRVQDFFSPFKSMAHRLHRALCDRESDILDPLMRLDIVKRDAITVFNADRQRRRREEERQLEEQARRDREAAAAAEAAALERDGEADMAAAVIEEAISAPVPVVALKDELKQIPGLHFTRRYSWRYVGNNKDKASKIIPRDFLLVDEKKIGAYARSMKGTGSIPGVEFFHEDVPTR